MMRKIEFYRRNIFQRVSHSPTVITNWLIIQCSTRLTDRLRVMSQHGRDDRLPEGIHSLLDTDLYKLTMQAALLQHYPNIGRMYRVLD